MPSFARETGHPWPGGFLSGVQAPQTLRAAMRLSRLPVSGAELASLEGGVSVVEPVHEQRVLSLRQEDFPEPILAIGQGSVEATGQARLAANRDQVSPLEQPPELAECSQQP